jgi:hypothetical protein
VPAGPPAATPGRGGEEKTNEIGVSLSQDDPPAPVGFGGVILGYIPPPLPGWGGRHERCRLAFPGMIRPRRLHPGTRRRTPLRTGGGQARFARPLAAAWRGVGLFAREAGRRSIARQFIAGNHENPVFPSGAPEGGGGTPSPVACLPRRSRRRRREPGAQSAYTTTRARPAKAAIRPRMDRPEPTATDAQLGGLATGKPGSESGANAVAKPPCIRTQRRPRMDGRAGSVTVAWNGAPSSPRLPPGASGPARTPPVASFGVPRVLRSKAACPP